VLSESAAGTQQQGQKQQQQPSPYVLMQQLPTLSMPQRLPQSQDQKQRGEGSGDEMGGGGGYICFPSDPVANVCGLPRDPEESIATARNGGAY